jgi:signal transduction histidine kinase
LVSHNLKTPLANVMGQLEICKQLLSQHPEVFKTMERKYLKIERSLFQIKDQLELTIATFKKQVQLLGEQELSYVMLWEQLKQEFPDKLEVVGSPDPVSLKPNEYFSLHLAAQVLIENALHYGTGKPQVKLVADLICVYNDGDGFPEKVLVHQGRTASVSGASSGVGLFYASNLLQSIGWELVLENTSGGALACLKKQAISNKHMAKIW